MSFLIRPVSFNDVAQLAEIYNYYVANTLISFEEEEVSQAEMLTRIKTADRAGGIWLVLEEDSLILGYAYCLPWKSRSAYRFSHEMTVYLSIHAQGKGYGMRLYQALLVGVSKRPIKSLLAIIALPNEASVALHEKIGMKKVAHFEQVGYKLGRWVDVGYWQMSLPDDPLLKE